jgi:hypothetical protein
VSFLSAQPARTRWDAYRERPFWRLVELFVARVFRGGGDSDAPGLDLGMGLVLTLLAMPGGFVSLLLLNKYGTFLQWLRGVNVPDPLIVSLPDEYFFIVLSMTVSGAVAVWRWDAIFPDRRDYMNLVHLPISTRMIFLANLGAVLFLATLVAIDVNGVSCVLFPAVIAATQSKFLFFVKFAAVHALAVVFASLFSFLIVFSMLGLSMAVLPPRTFKRISSYVRGLAVVYLTALLCTTFAIPHLLRNLPSTPPIWTLLLPSTWFVGLCQWLRGRSNPALTTLGHLALPAVIAIATIALCAYAIGYRRHFLRIPELSEAESAGAPSRLSLIYGYFDRFMLHTPFERAGFRFVWKTLFRSEAHRLLLTAVAGLGIVVSSLALMNAVELTHSVRQACLSSEALSIPFILSFLITLGLRAVFDIPTELPSNWIFQLMLDPDNQDCESLARKVILIAVVPWVLAGVFPVYVYVAGWWLASLHTILVLLWSSLLTNAVLIRFHKLPFTCTRPIFKQHSIVILLSVGFGFLLYAASLPEFESWALMQPSRFASLLPAALILWYLPYHLDKTAMEAERRLIFEDISSNTFELIQLHD